MAVFFTPDDAKRVNDVGRELMAVLTRGTNGEIDAALNAYSSGVRRRTT